MDRKTDPSQLNFSFLNIGLTSRHKPHRETLKMVHSYTMYLNVEIILLWYRVRFFSSRWYNLAAAPSVLYNFYSAEEILKLYGFPISF